MSDDLGILHAQVLHKHLLSSRVNTRDPAQAKLFYIPVYLGRFFNAQWQAFSDPADAWLINRDCHGLSPWDCWAEKWRVAVNVSARQLPQFPSPFVLPFPSPMQGLHVQRITQDRP
jgi:hypothetical protein